MNEPLSKCCTCGFEWPTGKNGAHSCAIALRKKLDEVTAQRDAILLQARTWACEAKFQRNTVQEVGSILGGIPDWGPIAAGVEGLRQDAERYRFVRELAWYVDQAAYIYDIGNTRSPWPGERAPVDADDAEAAVDAAMAQQQEGGSHE